MQLESSANIFIHDVSTKIKTKTLRVKPSYFQPPVLLEDISTEGLSPDLLVAGDIIAKKYDFMMGDLENNPYKVAQVKRNLKIRVKF